MTSVGSTVLVAVRLVTKVEETIFRTLCNGSLGNYDTVQKQRASESIYRQKCYSTSWRFFAGTFW